MNKIKKLLVINRGFIIAVVFLFSLRWSFADHCKIPTGSMIPTIEIGDHVFVNKLAYDLKVPFTKLSLSRLSEPQRGDVIVFEYPLNTSVNYVKRLIGVPGDTIEIFNGFVKINNQITLKFKDDLDHYIENLYTHNNFSYQEKMGNSEYTVNRIPSKLHPLHQKYLIPKDHYFFMGDNRDNSADGRYFGFVHRDRLLGKVVTTTYSLTFDQWIPHFKLNRFFKPII